MYTMPIVTQLGFLEYLLGSVSLLQSLLGLALFSFFTDLCEQRHWFLLFKRMHQFVHLLTQDFSVVNQLLVIFMVRSTSLFVNPKP